jgi:hypothetical protein
MKFLYTDKYDTYYGINIAYGRENINMNKEILQQNNNCLDIKLMSVCSLFL